MNTNWQNIHDALTAHDGDDEPPTVEEMLAYRRGELSEADEERVRALLVQYPELARAVANGFPEEEHRVVQFPWMAAVAAAIAIVFAGLYWQARRDLDQPRITAQARVLLPDGSRGSAEATTLPADGDSFVLVTPIISEQHFASYRIEIVDNNAKVLWKRDAGPPAEEAFTLVVPRAVLPAGDYQIVLYGNAQRIATYSVHVPKS
ncbi:MAG TPA: hypothetical protein VJZ00_10825 [Thermoanaerobaculia bacterium]|nr:hypothetical protein [Thermoanaerobaculia bacterium]